MPQRIVSNSFTAGEISPELYGRHDLKVYFAGAAKVHNFIVRRTGGIRKRPGTEELTVLKADGNNADTLGNKYAVFPYAFDSKSFGIIALRLSLVNELAELQYRLILFDTTEGRSERSRRPNTKGIIESGETLWIPTGIAPNITNPETLSNLRGTQVGDTIVFSGEGIHSFKCKITKADTSAVFTILENARNVPPPAGITAVAQNFHEAGTGWFATSYSYALYGVKDGVLSDPARVTVSDGVTRPWQSGATIKVSGTLNFGDHDYYILAKKSGINYGKISEIYPEEQEKPITEIVTESDASETPRVNVSTTETPIQAVFNIDKDSLVAGRQDEIATSKTSMAGLSKVAVGLKSRTEGNETFFITPTYHVNANAGGQAQVAGIWPAESMTNYKTMTAYNGRVPLGTPVSITPYYKLSGDTEFTAAPVVHTTLSTYGYWTAPLSQAVEGDEYDLYFKIVFVGSNASNYADAMFLSCVWVSENQGGTWVYLPITSVTLGDCKTTNIMLSGGAVYTNAWQSHDIADTAVSDEASRLAAPAAGTRSLNTAMCYNPTATRLSEVVFSVEAGKILNSISIHMGGRVFADVSATQFSESLKSIGVTITAMEGDVEREVATGTVQAGRLYTSRLSISYDNVTDPSVVTTYKIRFTENSVATQVIIRGFDSKELTDSFEMIDDNILPSETTGIQEMLVVGDTGMDCEIVDVYQQRLFFASSRDLPFTMWFSAVGDLFNFYALRPQADDDAFSITIPATKASKILHSVSDTEILLFTQDGVYNVSAGGDGLSYRTVRTNKVCGVAASDSVSPILIDGKTIFVGQDGKTVYELRYNLMDDAKLPVDRSVTSYHLFEGASIISMAYQRFPDSVIWLLLSDGTMASLTYMPEQDVYGWAKHSIDWGDRDVRPLKLISTGTVTSGTGVETTSDILMVCEEYQDGNLMDGTIIESFRQNICADSLSKNSATCKDHVGATSGTATTIEAELVTLRPEPPDSTTQGMKKNVKDVCIRIRRSGEVGVAPYSPVSTIAEKTVASPQSQTVTNITLTTGDVKVMPLGYINKDGQMRVVSSDQWPCEIQSIIWSIEVVP